MKQALAAAFNAISGHASSVNLVFEAQEKSNHKPGTAEFFPETSSLVITFPDPLSANKIAQLRGAADFQALKLKYHDTALHAARLPQDLAATAIFDAAEDARIEAVGREYMKGAGDNLQARLEHEWAEKLEIPGIENRQMQIIADLVGLVIRGEMGFSAPKSAEAAMDSYGRFIGMKIKPHLPALKDNLENQEKFAETVIEVIKSLKLSEIAPIEKQLVEDDGHEKELAENQQKSSKAEENSNAPATGLEQDKNPDENSQALSGTDKSQEQSDLDHILRNTSHADTRKPEYRAYTKIFDRSVSAIDLASQEELTFLRHQLDAKLASLKNVTNRLAYKLQRKLMAKQARHWDFGLEEGLLDAARLSRLIADPGLTHIYKWEKETVYSDTVVTLLLDNSGSMRGRPITVAAIAADILARTLERCRIKTEILGFTTAEWKGGKSRKLWMKQASPAHPGRLNDLLHIIYKSADTPWIRARKNLGLMLKEGLLKENIDGEAILWAVSRLALRRERRRILMVISDGAPVDDSTLSVMGGAYLDNHLREAIRVVENGTDIEMLAIGIGHDVTGYYSKAVTIREVEQLGDAMIGQLSEMIA